MATEAADIPDPISLTQKRDGVEDKELTSELSYTIVNEVPMEEEKKKVESSVNQPPETIEILEKTEHMQVVNGKEVPNVNVVDEGNVGNIDGEIFLKSSSVSDEKPMRNTEENQSITKEELSDLQDEKGCITDKNIIVEGSYAKAGPDVGDNLEEKTSMAYEDRSQEIVELSEKMKDVTTIDDEVQNKNFESSFVEKLEDISFQKVDNLETSKEESEAGMKYIVKESPDEADDQNEILRNIATTDGNLSTTGKVDENPEPKAEESMRESEDLTPPEALTMECKHERLMVLASEDNAEDTEKEKTETSKHEEHSVQSFAQKNEPAKANLGSPLDVTSEEIETPSPSEYAETMTNIEEQRPVGIPQEILGETRQDETIIADDINKNENPEAKNVSTVDLDEKTRSMEVEISSKNGNELYVTHPPIEETVKVEGEKQDEVSMSESGGRLHEVFEVPMEEAKRVNETFEASKSPEGIILEHTSTEGALNMEVTLATSELNINPEKGCELNSEKEIKEINAEENIKEETEQKEKAFDTEIQIATKSDDNEKSTTEEVVPVKNTTLCTGEEEYHHDQEDKNETLSSKEASPKLDTGDQGCGTSNETKNINDQIINEEAIQVYEDVKIADRGENTEKEMENEEHTVMDRSPESNGKHTTKCSKENEMDAEKQKAKIGEELETTNKSEVIEKQILAEENRVQDGLTVSAGEEFGTESSKEDDMTTKMSKEEVLEILQTADGSANIGIQTKKEDGTSKDKFVARDGEETKNECSYGKDEEKESDIEISLMNEDLNAQSITRSSSEETAQKESNLDIVENSSSVPEISEKGIKEEKDDSQVTMVAEETSLTEVEEKYKMPVDSSDMVSVEMGLLTTETSEMESNDIDNTEKPTETLNLDENEAMEILTASKHGADETAEKTEPEGKNESCDAISKTQNQREIATAETFLDEISDQNLQASSTLSVEEHNIVTPVSEATSEAPEKDKTLYGKEETPIVGETTEEGRMEEDESTNPKNDTKMEPIEIEKESANDDAQNEDPQLYTPPEVNNEKSISESDVELLNRVNTSEVTNCGEMGKLETSEDKMPSDTGIEKDKSEYKTEVNEATKGVEADGGCTDTDKDILEHEDSAKDFEGSSKNSIEIEKAPVEFEIEGHSHGTEASETKSISTLTEKNIETVEHGENHRSAPDSKVEDESNRRIPETNQANIPEESHDDENHTTDSTKEQISGQDIEEESTKMNEEIEPKLESQKEINKTQDTILNEKVPSEIERAVETEIIEEQTMQEESCTKELHMIPEADETVNEVRELDLTSIGSLETTSSNNNTEMVKSKVEEDLNQESKAMNEDINEPIEKPVNVLSSVSEVSAEKIEEENIGDTENCDDNADTAPTVVTDVTSLGEFQLNGEPVEAIDTSSDAKNLEATKTADSSQHDAEVDSMKIEGTSSIELQLPVHEHEKADNESITLEKSDANDVEVEETKIPDESKDQDVKEIHETGTSLTVEETDANEIEKQIREVPQALPQPINQAIEADIGAEIISPTVATEVTNLGEVQLNDESVKVLGTSSDAKSLERTKTADDNQQDAEVDSLKLQETSSMVYQLPMQEHEKEDNVSVTVEKSDANDVEAKETKIPETVPEFKDQGIKETHETGTSLIVGVIDANETEKQIGEVPEALSEPINKGVEAARDEEITLGQTLQAEKIEEPLQVPSSSLISEKQDSETTTTIEKSEDESTKKDDTQVDNLKHEENSGMVSELPITECESANNETVEKLDADEVEAKETETLEAVPESKDQGFQEIHETRTSPTTENTESDKIEEGVDAVADDETSDHPHPVGKLEEQLQVSSSALNCENSTTSKMDDESTKKDETEVDKIEPEEATGMLSKSPTIEYENADADEVQVETKTYKAISESTGDDVEEIHERIQPSTDTEDEENKGLEMPCDSTKDDFMSKDIACPDNQKTDKVIETSEAAGDTLDSSLFTAPIEDGCSEKLVQDVKGHLEENPSMACEDGSQETVVLSEKMKDVTSIEDEVQNQNLESFFVKEVEDICLQKADSPETSKEESETGMKDIVNESQNEEDNRNDILENIVTPDTNLSTIGKEDENPEPKTDASFREPNESMRRESEDIIPTEELTCQQEGFMVVAGEDNIVAAEQDQPETSNHEEHSEKSSFMQETEPATANLRSPLDVASGEIETTAPNEYAETITNIEEQRMDGIPQKILGETREDKIKKDENPEGKNLSTVDLDEKTRSTEVEIPNKNDNELYVTHPTVEETVQLGVEKQDEVSMSESGDQLHEAFEVPTEEEKHVNETYKASKSPQSTILDHTSIGEALNMDVTSTTNELDINLEHGSELNSEKEVKEINAEETIKEEIEQKEKASDTEIQISTKSDDNDRSTIEDDVTVKNDTPLCTGEEDYHHDQEDKIGPNSSKEASIELDSGDQSCRTSSETKNVNDHIINEETIQEYEDPKITDRGEEAEKEMKIEDHTEMGQKLETTSKSEGIEKQVLAEESRDQDWPTVSAGEELGTESPQEDAMKTKTSKEEVLEILQTADGSANIGIQTKEEDGTSKDNFVASDGEEIKNGYSCDKENEDKEPDTVVLEKNHGGQDTSEQIVKSSARNQSAESFLEKTVRESSQEDEASEEYETAGASTTTEESAITDLHSSSVGEEKVQENLKEDKTENMRSEKEASEKYKTAGASTTMEEISITDLPSSSVGEAEVQENLKEDKTETMRSEKEASEEYETAGVSMTMEESAITDLSSSVGEEKVQENLKEDETEAMRSQKEACEEHETVEASTTMEKSAIIDLPSSFVWEEKVEENLKENKTEAMRSEKEASEYETVGASMTIEVRAITDLPPSSVGEEKVQENLKEDKTEEMRSEKEAIEEYETVGASTTMEESAITDLPSSSVGEEKVQENLKEDETEAMRSEKGASEEYEIVGASTTMEESAITDLPSLSTVGEEKFQEYLKEGKTETMRSEQEASEEYETAGGSTTMEESTITDLPSSTGGEEKVQENLKEDETEAMRSEKEASEEYETAGGSTTMEESTITDLPSSTVGEGKVQENLKEDETEAMRSEKEVRNSNIECIERDFVTTLSTKEREANTLQDEAETNDGFNSESFTRSSEEETAKKESNLDLVENYSSVPDISEKEIKEEILEKADSEATVVIEETSLTEAEVEHKMQVDSSNMVSEEKGLLTTETSEMESNGIDTIAKTIETSNLGENKDMEIPTARKHGADEAAEKIEPEGKNETCDAISNTEDQREIATVETSLDDISEQNLQASSTTSLEEHNFLTPDVSETRVEAPEKDKTLYGNAETPIVPETTEENIMEKEDESTNQINNTNVEPIEIEKESANDDAQNEDQESYTSPEMNNEKSTCESDIEILKSVSTSQIPDCSEIGKLETVEDEKLSDTGLEKDQSDYEMAVSEDSKGVKADGGCIETEKAIQEKDDSAMNFEEKESVEIKKPQVEFEAGGHSHGTEASETRSISTLAEKVPREIERATESEIIEEQTNEEESCTKEPQMIAVADETINEMKDLDLTPIQSLETTASNDNTEMVKSKLAEDLNQESEASSMKITMKDEIKKPIEKPVNVSSLVSEVSEEKFEEENIEDTENCDDDTNIAPTMLTDVTNLGEVQLNDKPVKALDASSDAKSLEPATIADTSQHDAEVDSMKLESDANDVEAEGTKIPDSVSESKDQGVKEIHETDTSLTVGETETNEIDKQIREVPEALSEPLNQGVETANNDEIIAPTVAIEVTSVGKVHVNDEPVNALDTSSDAKSLETTKAADIVQQDEEVDSMRPKEASTMVCQLPIHEHEKAGNEITVEKSDANDDEVEELKISDAVPDSKDQCVKEFNETGTSLIMGETDANEIEKQIREVPEGLSEPINQGVEADRDDEITPGQTLQAEKIEEQLQVPSSSLISKEQDSETTTTIEKSEDGSTKKDDTQVDNLKPVESSGMVSELPITNCESANNETVEKLDADEVEVEETKTLDAVSESKDQGFEEIHETGTSQTTENAPTAKIEQEIQEANEKISDPIYQGVDSVVDGETSDHPLPLGKLEDESTKEDETEIDNIELVEATGMLLKLPAIEHKNADMSATIEKSDANEVQVEESKTSEAISESKVHGVEEIHEIGPSLTVGNTHTDKVEEIKEAPDTIFKPTYQCVEAVIDREITINQTLPTQRNEQLQEPSSALPKEQNHETPTNVELIKDESTTKDETQPNENVACSFPTSITEKPCLQDEGPRELDVSNLELKAQESQNKAPEEESIALEETSTVEPQEYIPEIKCADCPMEYEIIPIQCSSQGTSKDEDIINSGDSNKESDNLPPPYAAVKDLLQGEVGEMCEEASNLKFEKTAKVLESASEIHSPEVPPTSEGIEIIEEQLKGVITETRDGKNHSEEATEADEAIKKDISNGKAIDEEHKQITQENPVARNSHPVSPHEETVTKSNQEDELRAEDYPGKRTNITFEIIENEIQHEEMFEESEEAGEDKYIKETITTEDKTFKDGKVSVGDGTANVNPPEEAEDGKNIEKVPNRLDHENQGDETNFEDAATEATAPIKEFKPSEVMLVSHEEDRTCDNDEETVMRNDEHLQNTDLVVPPVIDAAAEEAPDEKVRENFEEVSEPAPKGPTHRTIETYEENKEIASSDTNNSENLMDSDKLESRFLQPACEESGVREDMNLKEQEVSSNIPSISSCAATSHEKIADKDSEKTADKKDGFVSDKQTTEAVSILEQEKSIQFEEEHTKDEEPVELSTMGNERKLDETKIHSTTTTNGDEETQYQNEKPNLLSHIKDSSREVSHEKGIMDLDKVNEITEGTQDLEKTSIAISQEQVARRANPTESAETTNSTASKDIPQMQDDPTTKIFQNPEIEDLKAGYASGFEPEAKGVECGEEKRMGEESEETTEKSVMMESAEFSLSDFMHGSRKQTLPVVEHLTEERELTGNKEEPQTESAERVQVEETKTEEGKDEYEEGDEHKRADSGSDAPVMVEASTDTDVKIVHKKHHNILSGVGSKVKHSLAKMKKAITGKSSHPKTPSAVK